MKGLYRLRVTRDIFFRDGPASKPVKIAKKGEILECFGMHWHYVPFGPVQADIICFLVWTKARSWTMVEKCYVEPLGAPRPLVSPCNFDEDKGVRK